MSFFTLPSAQYDILFNALDSCIPRLGLMVMQRHLTTLHRVFTDTRMGLDTRVGRLTVLIYFAESYGIFLFEQRHAVFTKMCDDRRIFPLSRAVCPCLGFLLKTTTTMSDESDVILFSLVDMLTDRGYIVSDAGNDEVLATEQTSGFVINLRSSESQTIATWFVSGRRYMVVAPTTRDGIAVLLDSIAAQKHGAKVQQCDCKHE